MASIPAGNSTPSCSGTTTRTGPAASRPPRRLPRVLDLDASWPLPGPAVRHRRPARDPRDPEVRRAPPGRGVHELLQRAPEGAANWKHQEQIVQVNRTEAWTPPGSVRSQRLILPRQERSSPSSPNTWRRRQDPRRGPRHRRPEVPLHPHRPITTPAFTYAWMAASRFMDAVEPRSSGSDGSIQASWRKSGGFSGRRVQSDRPRY